MGIFYKEFGLKKILECEGAKSWEEIKVGDTVQLILNLEDYNLTGFKKQVGALWEFKGKAVDGAKVAGGAEVVNGAEVAGGAEAVNDAEVAGGAEVVNDVKAVIGVIPEEEGKLIKDFLDMGWNKLFKAVISQNDNTKPLENRFKVAVYIEQCDFKETQNVDQGSSKKPDVQSDDSQGGK